MSGCLVYSDIGTVAERLTDLLHRDRPTWVMYRASEWDAAIEVVSVHQVAWIILAAPLNWQTLSAIAELRRLASDPPIVLFADSVQADLRSVLAEHRVALLPQMALETLFSQQSDDMLNMIASQSGADLTHHFSSGIHSRSQG
ncbi:hypothetical protein [Salinibius halmophilus]|uniref:hypothetical protein n=1 Tax=Salinibius halmophilus TaxID=1853216 RepID=UPI001313DEEB|nr:hypothetical protein [Salinibius halmophilus]